MKSGFWKMTSILAVAALFAASCTPEENNPSGTDEPGGGKDGTVHVTGISLDHPSATIKEGETLTLVATVTPDNAANKTVKWSTSSETVATVDNNGKVTGIKAGSATITATTEDGGKKATCALTVEANLAPSVTVGADHISAISVVLRGKANLGTSAASDLKVGFQYSKSAGILPSNSSTVDADDADANYNYTKALTGLEPATTYYFRSFVRQNGQDTYGETKEFSTKDLSSLIHTQDASQISAVSGKLNASLDLTDVQYNTKTLGFYWGSSAESLTSKVTAQEGEVVSADISKLSPSKEYFYQAFIVLNGKELKEEVLSFTTKDVESLLSTIDATGIEATSATLNAKLDLTDVKYSSKSYGFYWGTSESSQNARLSGGEINDNVYLASLTSLSHKTQYWFKAYLTLDGQTLYGEVKTFTTDVVKVESVSLDKSEYTFNTIGNTLTLKATVLPSDATDKSVEWTSSNEDVATVDANGKVTAKGNGTATITVTTKNQGKSATCAITVAQQITSLSLNKTSLTLNEGEEETLTPTIKPDNTVDKTLTWTSSDESVAKVDADGKVTALSKGSATIKAEAKDGSGKYAICYVTVKRLVASIELDKTTITLYRGASDVTETIITTVTPSDASNTSVQWTSSNTAVAMVSSSGVVTGKSRGTATITATAKDGGGASTTCEVEVKQYVTNITLSETSISLVIGEEATISATSVQPASANDLSLTWTSSDESVAKVDADGKVTAVTKGKASITFWANDGSGVSASCTVVVSNPCPEGTVDIGVTTSEGYKLYWATSNLSEDGLCPNPEDYGDYYAWGETAPYYSSQSPLTWKNGKSAGYDWASYKWCNGTKTSLTKYNAYTTSYGTLDNKTVLEAEDDVASKILGGEWRMPTEEDYTALFKNCNWIWTTQNGVNGWLFTSKKNGNSIFLPAAGYRYNNYLDGNGYKGYYWSSSLCPIAPLNASHVYFHSSKVVLRSSDCWRCYGYIVRPVSE